MPNHRYPANIRWQLKSGEAFTQHRYSRAHTWQFDQGPTVQASSSPSIVPLPYSVAEFIDPEAAFVASLASCHMLWFLDFAAKANFIVEYYADDADGVLANNSDGQLAITEVNLRPRVRFDAQHTPSESEFQKLHEQTHNACFIANSVKASINIEALIIQ